MKPRPRRLLSALVLFLAASAGLALVPGGFAQDADAQGQEASEVRVEEWQREERDVTAEKEEQGFAFQSERRSGLGRDMVAGEFDVSSARFDWEFISTDPGNETVRRIAIHFDTLIEFEDQDGDGRLGFGDTVVQKISLSGRSDGLATVEPLLGGGYRATVEYPLNRSSSTQDDLVPIDEQELLAGRFALIFHLSPTAKVVGGVPVPPTQTKFDIEIEGFPYLSNGTLVALQTRVSSAEELTPTGGRVHSSTRPFEFFYAWRDDALVDGSERSVEVTVFQDVAAPTPQPGMAEPVMVTFSYDRGDRILHDPSVGVFRYQALAGPVDFVESLLKGDWRLYGPALLFTLVAVAGSAAVRLRRGP